MACLGVGQRRVDTRDVYARKKATVATVPDQASTGSSEDTDFGANDWLLEEMYEQYTTDPGSVDES